MQGESITTDIAEDHQSLSQPKSHSGLRQSGSDSGYSDEPFKPLNLTYSLVKERLILSFQTPPNAGERVVDKVSTANSFELGLKLRHRLSR